VQPPGAGQFGGFLESRLLRLQQALQRRIVIPQMVFAEPGHGPAGSLVRFQGSQPPEVGGALLVLVLVVFDRTGLPQAFNPVRLELERLPVESQGLHHPFGVARLGGLAATGFEGRRGMRLH
jgi:hypothetical protein